MGIVPLGKVRFPVNGLDAHLLHQGAHMLSADLLAFQAQQIAEHPATGERVFEMQFVDASHEGQIRR